MRGYDTVVVGAGPAGLSAAIRTAGAGAKTMVVDSGLVPGGQLTKQIHKFFGSAAVCAGRRGIRLGQELYQTARESGCDFLFDCTVYDIEDADGGYKVFCSTGEKTIVLAAKTVILALGASENGLAFPGWTMPGVITAGAAQTLVNLYRVPCGQRVLMVGAGNVGLIVAYQLKQAGIEVAAVIEASPTVGGYEVHAAKIRRAGIPVLTGHTIVNVLGKEKVEGAVIAQVDKSFSPIPGTEKKLAVDTICLAVGLSPLVKLGQVAGCSIAEGGRMEAVIEHDEEMATSKPGIYVAGDAGGVEEASVAMEEGAIAGLSAARHMGLLQDTTAHVAQHQSHICAIRKVGQTGALCVNIPDYEPFQKAKALIECCQEIPCNPCEKNCPVGAITIGEDLCSLPVLDLEKCTGCGICVAQCPGQACFLLNLNHGEGLCEIAMPYEYLPLPATGQTLTGLDRQGKPVCEAKVHKVTTVGAYDQTHILRILVPREHAGTVRAVSLAGGGEE